MKPPAALLALLLAGGCDLVPERLVEQGYDPDGDGVAWPEDCDSTDPSRFPGAAEIWYDGVDQDCGLDDDYDRDGDGWIPSVYVGLPTAGVEGSGSLPGGDCWDDPESQGEDHIVIPDTLSDAAGQPLAWAQPSAAQVHPGATEVFYDGVDQDCDGQDDLDQDGDGWRTSAYPDRGGFFGDDCIDGAPLDEPNPAAISPDEAHPGATEVYYDGTDQDCDTEDCDQDGDGQPADPQGLGFCTQQDCDDTDPGIGSGAGFEEVWYDGLDQDCDGDDGDQDGDGYWVADYLERVVAAGGAPLPIPAGMEGDCWDLPAEVEAIPTDYVALNGYPQPAAAEVFPGAEDPVYDGIDQDCAADGDFDLDQDGAAADSVPDRAGEVGDDCDDDDPNINPWALEIWYDGRDPNCDDNDGDQDGDGFWAEDYEARVAASGGSPMAVPSGYEGDCDDLDRSVYPSADEWCDGVDSDCDGLVDEQALDAATWYTDADADGYGDAATATLTCTQPSGTVSDATDCDDTDAGVNPGALEVCDHVDDDCDGLIDQLDPSVADALTWYADADGDSYGDAADPGALWCAGDEPAGSLLSATDCDDTDAGVNPAAVEVCDRVDNDCDGSTDEPDAADAGTWYADADADGWGDPAVVTVECWQPTGTVADASDCDDSAPSVYPGAAERVGDGTDQDCDGQELCFEDLDGDAWGGGGVITSADLDCGGAGEAWENGDCDDADASISPDATEVAADGVDQDCDGTELCYQDLDGDAFGGVFTVECADLACGATGCSPSDTDCDDGDATVYPGAEEGVADGVDQDCDGLELCWEDADADGVGSEVEIASADPACATAGVAATSGDCDDTDPARSPALAEVPADGIDNDCDGSEACYADADLDGYGTGATVASADLSCLDPGESSVGTDCDDAAAEVFPDAAEAVGDGVDSDCDGVELCWEDADGDGFGGTTVVAGSALDCSGGSESVLSSDCDDTAAGVYPGAVEIAADGVDEDCDGAELCWEDLDGDTWGSSTTIASTDFACTGAGLTAAGGDCDDGEPGVNPSATEVCGAVDEDCDGLVDDDDPSLDPSGASTWYPDADLDGYGDSASPLIACTAPSGAVLTGGDCDDGDPGVNPVAAERCNGGDDDCDGVIDEPSAVDAATWYADTDADGYGDPAISTPACTVPSGYVAAATDCDDADADVHPGADEWCDGADDDCDGVVDEDDALDAVTWYEDADGDGWGAAGTDLIACDQPSGHVAASGDCDDTQDHVNPDAPEICGNGQDDNCDGSASGCTPLGTLSLSRADARLLGDASSDFAGCSVAGPGDIDGDGNDDLLVGARGTGAAAGSVHLFLGPMLGDVSLAAADAVWRGEASGDRAGWVVAGDAEEGMLLVGAYGASVTASLAGAAYLVAASGTGELSLADADARLLGEAAGDEAGYAAASAGDQDGDGITDWIVGAWGEDSAGSDAGSAYLVSGAVAGDLLLGGASACLRGENTGEYAGWSVAGGADADGDGLADLLVGAPAHSWASTGTGAAYLLYGPVSGDFSLAAADARLLGAGAEWVGYALDFVGDVDGDGLDDMLLGAYRADAADTDAGLAYLVLGGSSGDIALDAGAEARLLGVAAGDHAGWSVAGGGDVDGDGNPDLLVGAPEVSGSVLAAGAAYLVLGPVAGDLSLADADAVLHGEGEADSAGLAVTMPGDVDGDGWGDLLIAAPEADLTASDAGAAYLVLGGGL
ncbi:MAG: putative metal-binding motif-containing protein [Pseudomonadota bacterium]